MLINLLQGTSWDDPNDPKTQWDDLWEKWDTAGSDNFISQVMRGMKGLNVGLPNGVNAINKYMHGTHRGRYYLIGADSGVGKSTLTDYMFVISLWLHCEEHKIPLHIKYFSFEMSREAKIAGWVGAFIKRLYGLEFPADYIMGRIDGKPLANGDLKRIKYAYAIVQRMMTSMHIIDVPMHPTGILNLWFDYYEKTGIIHRTTPKEAGKKGYIVGYTPNNPMEVCVGVYDHLALAHEEAGLSGPKAVMDRSSMYFVQLRNLFNNISAVIQQFNTELTSMHRANRKTEESIAPQRIDFGDTKYTYRDADVVLGLLKPAQFDLDKYKKYDIGRLKSHLIMKFLMKNRYGHDGRMLPLFMNPPAGSFQDLPTDPTNEMAMEPWYNEAKRLDSWH